MTARRAALGVLAVSLLLAGCGAQNGSLVPVPPASSPPPAATPAVVVPSFGPTASVALPPGTTVQQDPSLLGLLPASIAGVAVKEEPDSFAEAVKDAAFVSSVDRAAFAIAVSGADLASGVLAHLRPGIYSDKMFEDWRASYDEGACATASGVVAHAQESQGSRTIYVTTCGGGLRVYHTYLAAKNVIVSIFSTGAQDFGGQMVAGLQG